MLLSEDRGCRFGWHERDVFVLIDDNPLEQCAVEDAAFSRFAPAVEVAEIGEDTDDLIESLVSVVVGGRETVEAVGDRVEAGADAVLFGLEQIERDGVGAQWVRQNGVVQCRGGSSRPAASAASASPFVAKATPAACSGGL